MKIKQITETTTAGAIATVNSPLGGTQSRGNPSIYGGKKVGSLFKGKKTSAPYANSINESAELSEAQLEEDDVIVVPGQGRSRKNGLVPHGQSRLDHEVEMARSDLFSAAKNAQQVFSMIKDVSEDEGLDGWVQEKIIKANDYLNTIREYLEGKQVQGLAEGTDDNAIWNQYGQYSKEDLMQEFPQITPKDAQTIVNYSQYAWDFVKSGATKQPEFINAKNQVIQRVQQAMRGQQGLAEGYDPVESDYRQWEDILVKDGYRGEPSGAYALELVVGHQLMSDPAEVASTIRNILTYVKQNRQVLGKAVSDRTTVKDAIIDIKNKFPQQYQAAQQPQGVAEGRLDELGNTDAGRKALRAVQKRGGDEITAWNKKPESGYSPTPTNAAKHFNASVSAGNRLYGHGPNTLRKDTVLARDAMRRYHKGEPITPKEVEIISKWYPGFKVEEGIAGQQGVAEGSRNAYLKHNNLVDIEKPLAGLKSEFEKFLQTHEPKEKQKYQQGIKQRIKSEPMSGPKGVLPEQGVAEGKRNLKCVCRTHGTMQCPVHTPKDIEVIENNKNKKA